MSQRVGATRSWICCGENIFVYTDMAPASYECICPSIDTKEYVSVSVSVSVSISTFVSISILYLGLERVREGGDDAIVDLLQ